MSSEAAGLPETQSWAPMVYGRTRQVDQWWRALPEAGLDRWLEHVVHAAVAGGRGLTTPRSPARFILSRGHHRVLLAIACSAASISETMNTDMFGRNLYALVGWITGNPHAQVPALPDLAEHALDWASVEYQRWLAPHWDEPQAPTASTPAGEAPWPLPVPSVAEPLTIKRGTSLVVPAAQDGKLWESARAAGAPLTIAVGWNRWHHADLQTLNAVAAADVESPALVPTYYDPPASRTGSNMTTLISDSISRFLHIGHGGGDQPKRPRR